MEAYPVDFTEHNLPLVILSGLEYERKDESNAQSPPLTWLGDGGFRIRASSPHLSGPLADNLRTTLLSCDASNRHWSARDQGGDKYAFKIRSVGRNYLFPSRKAPPPPHAPRLQPENDGGMSPPPLVLHSTLSPLTPSSPLWPDGMIDSAWINKHQARLPAIFVTFYALSVGPTSNTVQDESIKSEILSIRNVITSSHYKTKLVLVLVGAGAINHTELEERLINIRRGAGIDNRNLYYLSSATSQAEISDFARSLFTTLYPSAIEYYRDLSKHARRKRNRTSIPQSTVPLASDELALSPHRWNVRYEFKLAVFAEFRQEMDAACRSYETTYDSLSELDLLSAQSSQRATESRILADVLAIRIIRCLCWTSRTSPAVRWWLKHDANMKNWLSSAQNAQRYDAWLAWRLNWSRTMAQLVQRAAPFSDVHSRAIYLPSQEAIVALDRHNPWENMHHEGYWLYKTLRNEPVRKASVSSGIDMPIRKSTELTQVLQNAFTLREQYHFVAMILLMLLDDDRASTTSFNSFSSETKLYSLALWRQAGWWHLVAYLNEARNKAVSQTSSPLLMYPFLCELDFMGQESSKPLNPSTNIDLDTQVSSVTPSFAFAFSEGHAGEPARIQFGIHSLTNTAITSHRLIELSIMLSGNVLPMFIRMANAAKQNPSPVSETITVVHLARQHDDSPSVAEEVKGSGEISYNAEVDLVLQPGQSRLYNFEIIPGEPGLVALSSIRLSFQNESHITTMIASEPVSRASQWWETKKEQLITRQFGRYRDVTSMNILPKLPKVAIKFLDVREKYYLDESMALIVQVENGETERIDADLELKLTSPISDNSSMKWTKGGQEAKSSIHDVNRICTLGCRIVDLDPSQVMQRSLTITGSDHSLRIEVQATVSYSIASGTTLNQTDSVPIVIDHAFKASNRFVPRVIEAPWPDFFKMGTNPSRSSNAAGLQQRYVLEIDLVSLVEDELRIHKLEVDARRVTGDARMLVSENHDAHKNGAERDELPRTLRADDSLRLTFNVEIQKNVLSDRQLVACHPSLVVEWSRPESEERNSTILALSRFLPQVSEPRALLTVGKPGNHPHIRTLTYTIENPSMHFLRFSLVMESGEDYAFSGPKIKSISLVPFSRHQVRYNIYTDREQKWITVRLSVTDTVFNQSLPVQPASRMARTNTEGDIEVWSGSEIV